MSHVAGIASNSWTSSAPLPLVFSLTNSLHGRAGRENQPTVRQYDDERLIKSKNRLLGLFMLTVVPQLALATKFLFEYLYEILKIVRAYAHHILCRRSVSGENPYLFFWILALRSGLRRDQNFLTDGGVA